MSNQANQLVSEDVRMYVSDDQILISSHQSDFDFAEREGLKEFTPKGYSTIEGCIRQSMELPIENSG